MTSFEKFAEIWHDTSDLWSYWCYRIDLGIVSYIFKDEDYKNQWIFVAFLTVDLQIQGHALFCVTFHVSGCVCSISLGVYQRDLGVYFLIFEVQDHNDDIINKYCNVNHWPSNSRSRAILSDLSISQAGFVLSERSYWCLFPHIWGSGSQ